MYHEPEVEREMCTAKGNSFFLCRLPMIAAVISLSLVPAPHPSLQPAQIHSTTTPSISAIKP